MDVGATLRQASLANRLTLEQLSRATKISGSNLRALESNDFERLPAAIYTRGFLRAYAREVNLDPQQVVDQYQRQVDEALETQRAESERVRAEAAATTRVQRKRTGGEGSGWLAAFAPGPVKIQIDWSSVPRPALVAGAVILAGLVLSVFVARNVAGASDAADAAPADPAATSPASPEPATADAVRAVNVEDGPLELRLTISGPCWVAASADRAPVFARLLRAGDTQTIAANDEIVMRVGEPATIRVTVNGAPLRSLGRGGTPVTVVITRDNLREWLAP